MLCVKLYWKILSKSHKLEGYKEYILENCSGKKICNEYCAKSSQCELNTYKYYRGHQIGAPYFDLGTI